MGWLEARAGELVPAQCGRCMPCRPSSLLPQVGTCGVSNNGNSMLAAAACCSTAQPTVCSSLLDLCAARRILTRYVSSSIRCHDCCGAPGGSSNHGSSSSSGQPSVDAVLEVAGDAVMEWLDAAQGAAVVDPGIFRAHAEKYEVGGCLR